MFRHLDHVGIMVRDLDQALERVEKVLGLTAAVVEDVPDQAVRVALVPTRVGRFELMQPTASDSIGARFLERRGEGLHHLCFAVDNVDDARRSIISQWGEMTQPKPQESFTGIIDFVHPTSTSGVLVEINQVTRFTPATSRDLQFHHVTLRTHDMDASVALWNRLFDMPVKRKAVSEGFAMSTGWLDAGDAEVEFAQQLNETGPVARALKSLGEGLHAVVLESDDPEAVVERARAQGVRVIVDEGDPTNVLRAIHPGDFLGTLILVAARNAPHTGMTSGAATAGEAH